MRWPLRISGGSMTILRLFVIFPCSSRQNLPHCFHVGHDPSCTIPRSSTTLCNPRYHPHHIKFSTNTSEEIKCRLKPGQVSCTTTGYGLDDRRTGVRLPAARPAARPIQLPIQWLPEALSSRDKPHEVGHSLPSSVEIKSGEAIPHLPHTTSKCRA